jgi:hypothetical protein
MRAKEAYVHWNAGICYIATYPGQKRICYSRHFRRATRKARNLGYNVRVYKSEYTTAPRDAVKVTGGSYVLPRKKAK